MTLNWLMVLSFKSKGIGNNNGQKKKKTLHISSTNNTVTDHLYCGFDFVPKIIINHSLNTFNYK